MGLRAVSLGKFKVLGLDGCKPWECLQFDGIAVSMPREV